MLPPPDLICCCAFCNASGGMSLASSSLRPTFSCCTVVLFSFVSVELEGPRAQRRGVGGKDFRKSGASKMWRGGLLSPRGGKKGRGGWEGGLGKTRRVGEAGRGRNLCPRICFRGRR